MSAPADTGIAGRDKISWTTSPPLPGPPRPQTIIPDGVPVRSAGLSPGRTQGRDVDRGGIARLPAGQRVDRVDLDEAVPVPEGLGGLVRLVAGRAVQGLGLHHADPGGRQAVEDVAEQPGPVAVTTAGGVDGDPQDLRAAGRFPGGDSKA